MSFTTFLKSFIFKNFKRELPYTRTVGRLFHLMVNNVQDNQKNKTQKKLLILKNLFLYYKTFEQLLDVQKK